MFDRAPDTDVPRGRLVAQAAPGLPVDRLCLGKPVDEVRALVPRLFNLCRDAQADALDAALGFAPTERGLNREVLRDHLLKLYVTWPGLLGMGAQTFPRDWEKGGPDLARALFGMPAGAPETPDAFLAFLRGDTPVAEVLRRIRDGFAPGDAVADGLAFVDAGSVWLPCAQENSVAARQATHPVMRDIETSFGRGPFWRAVARIYDIASVLAEDLPPVASPTLGKATAPAARGLYAVEVTQANGCVTALHRVTPTDHLLAKGGMLDRSLASLPSDKLGLGPLVLDILDPCSPVRLREVAHA